jgi:archaemetzincin
MLKDSIASYYPVTVRLAPQVGLPANAYYKPRNRYKADLLIGFLHTLKPAGARIISGVTCKDISTRKGTITDFGVMGLGLTPGDVCVTSIYRMQGDKPSSQLLARRLLKTVVHELGHNFGLQHCPNKSCIMADAEGKLNQDNETGFCPQCRKRLSLIKK